MSQAWKKEHPEAVKKHNSTHKAKLRRKRNIIKKRYGIDLSEYVKLLEDQNNVCDLCKEPFGKSGSSRPVLDHDHNTKKIRAFIHDKCNVAIGRLDDSAEKCKLAAEYLERYFPVDPDKK